MHIYIASDHLQSVRIFRDGIDIYHTLDATVTSSPMTDSLGEDFIDHSSQQNDFAFYAAF